MSRPTYTRTHATTTARGSGVRISDSRLPTCDNPVYVDSIVVPAAVEQNKKCRRCKEVRPPVAFEKTGDIVFDTGLPIRRQFCRRCQEQQKESAS